MLDEDEDSEIESRPDSLLTSCSTGPPGTNCIIKNVKNNIHNNVGSISNSLLKIYKVILMTKSVIHSLLLDNKAEVL